LKLPVLAFCIALVPLESSYAQTPSDLVAKEVVLQMSNEEPSMQRAFGKAAATLPEFLRLAASPKEGTSRYALKVGLSDGVNTEYFWVKDFSNKGDEFTGTLNNEPSLVKKHKRGDRITFERAQVVDWTYSDTLNKKMIGNFTACALLSKQPPEVAAEFKRSNGLSCEEWDRTLERAAMLHWAWPA
jgi:uncharacterized protein YegJ (DUF2314 family)